jgi:hypothetical protein
MWCDMWLVAGVSASFLPSSIRYISKFINTSCISLNLRFLTTYGRLVTRTFLVFFNNRRGVLF